MSVYRCSFCSLMVGVSPNRNITRDFDAVQYLLILKLSDLYQAKSIMQCGFQLRVRNHPFGEKSDFLKITSHQTSRALS